MEREVGKGISPERVVKILSKHGTEVNLKEAGLILGFMERLVSIAVNGFFRNTKALTPQSPGQKLR